MAKLVECVPNFSEGRRPEIIEQIVEEIRKVDDVQLLDYEMDANHNRAVVTFIGTPEGAKIAAFNACKKAAELIDLNQHSGEHPRMGATDVIPFVPISEITMDECVALAHAVAKEIADKLDIPTYMYEHAATKVSRKKLPNVRKGEFEGLREAIQTDPKRAPDYGKCEVHPTAGATAVGAREFLIAYNVNLATKDVDIAMKIANAIRGIKGNLKYVRALGFELEDRGITQVSMNLVNYKQNPMYRVFEMIKSEAERWGAPIVGGEIVGLVPMDALIDVADFYLRLENFDKNQVIENQLLAGGATGGGKMGPTAFLDEVASDSPAPGGGSVASLAGALGAALTAMVCNLTRKKKAYKAVKEEMLAVLGEAETLRHRLTDLIQEDADAFDEVMAAFKIAKDDPEREAAIQNAYKKAAQVPLETARTCKQVLDLARVVAEKGNVNSISDAGVAALMAQSGVRGAIMNVKINLTEITDETFKAELRHELVELETNTISLAEEILAMVNGKIEG